MIFIYQAWPRPGLLLADAEIQKNGLDLPGFDPLTYEDTIFRPHGTGVRRLEQEMEQETSQAEEAKAEEKWEPENHPSYLDLVGRDVDVSEKIGAPLVIRFYPPF